MSDEPDSQPLHIGRAARAHILLIAFTTIIGLLLGFAASTQLEQGASATTSILLNPLDGNAYYPSTRGEQLVNLGTEAEALRSDAVAAIVEDDTGSSRGASSLLDHVSVSNPANTQILDVTFSADDAATAEEYSQAFAEAYLEYRTQRAAAVIGTQVEQLDAQIATAQAKLDELSKQIVALPSSSAAAEVLRQQSQAVANQIGDLTSRQADLAGLSKDPGQVITPASGSSSSAMRMTIILIVAGGLVGFAVGLAIALIRSTSDRRIHSTDDLDALGVAVLGTFGTPERSSGPPPADLPVWTTTPHADEQIRKIRVALLARQRVQPWVVMVSGASQSEHAPLLVPELAGAMARSGLETIVVQAMLGASEPDPFRDDERSVGLCQLLVGNATVNEAITHVAPMLSVIGLGEAFGEVSDLFVGSSMQRLVIELKTRCDVVIIAADPIGTAGAQSLTHVVDGVVLEVDQHVTTRSEVESAVRTLKMLGVTLDGAVLIGRDAEEWAASYRPHATMSQRELTAGKAGLPKGKGTLGPAEESTLRARSNGSSRKGRRRSVVELDDDELEAELDDDLDVDVDVDDEPELDGDLGDLDGDLGDLDDDDELEDDESDDDRSADAGSRESAGRDA